MVMAILLSQTLQTYSSVMVSKFFMERRFGRLYGKNIGFLKLLLRFRTIA